jgi:sugar phosphate isomerase/epimerase
MRFSFVVSSGLGYKIEHLFHNESSFNKFEKALRTIKENGFEGVELNLSFDDQRKLDRIKAAIDDSGLKLAAVGTGMVYVKRRLSFTDEESDKRSKALAIVKNLIHFVSGEDTIVIIGRVRGSPSQHNKSTDGHLHENLKECDRAANENNVRIALEAINRYETSLLNTAADVTRIIEQERLTATGLLLDTFHMNIEEQSISDSIRNNAHRTVHFHIADNDRWPPGHGHLEIATFLRILKDSGYKRWVSAETLPKPNNTQAVTHTAEFLKSHKLMRS